MKSSVKFGSRVLLTFDDDSTMLLDYEDYKVIGPLLNLFTDASIKRFVSIKRAEGKFNR
jgi:hypothetical protein